MTALEVHHHKVKKLRNEELLSETTTPIHYKASRAQDKENGRASRYRGIREGEKRRRCRG